MFLISTVLIVINVSCCLSICIDIFGFSFSSGFVCVHWWCALRPHTDTVCHARCVTDVQCIGLCVWWMEFILFFFFGRFPRRHRNSSKTAKRWIAREHDTITSDNRNSSMIDDKATWCTHTHVIRPYFQLRVSYTVLDMYLYAHSNAVSYSPRFIETGRTLAILVHVIGKRCQAGPYS